MRSMDEGVARTEGTAPRVVDANHGLRSGPRPVWVRLDALYVRDPGMPRHVNGAGIDLSGEVPGQLTHWVPTLAGDWMGRVTFPIRYADGRREPLWLRDQLVAGYALRPRDEPA